MFKSDRSLRKITKKIKHLFDVWHFGKSIKNNLSQLDKRIDCAELAPWLKAVMNHMWWGCATCDSDAHILKKKMAQYIISYTRYSLVVWFRNVFPMRTSAVGKRKEMVKTRISSVSCPGK